MKPVAQIQAELAAPFPVEQVGWKPQTIKDNRALAVAFMDARDVMKRLDAVVGSDAWEDSYVFLPDHNVVCTLRVRFGDVWVSKMDVGGESDQKDCGDRAKAAVSDALKRAAVKFGIGRYLYDLPMQWADYDPQKKCFVRPPQLPQWAIPEGDKPAPRPTPAKPSATNPAPAKETAVDKGAKVPPPPKDAAELFDRLRQAEAEFVAKGLCDDGEVMAELNAWAEANAFPDLLPSWSDEQVKKAIDFAKQLLGNLKKRPAKAGK